MKLAGPILLAVLTTQAAAQNAEVDRFRALIEDIPELPLGRIELGVDPAVSLDRVSAVSVDALGNLYVLHRPSTGNPVVVLDPEGRYLRSWGAGMFTIPHGIRVDAAGNVWTVDSKTSRVYKFSAQGDLLLEIAIDAPDAGPYPCGTADIAFGEDYHIFVADGYCNGRVIEFDPMGGQIQEWGTRGTGPGQFVVVHSVAIGPDGIVFVADRDNGRLQRFDQSGQFLGLWEYAGQLFSVAFSPAGELYVSTSLGGEPEEAYLIKLDPSTGEMLGKVEGFGHELAFTPDGSLLPATVTDQVLLFRPRQ
jgi:streptogramin lyase